MKLFPSSHESRITGFILAYLFGLSVGLFAKIFDAHPEVFVTAAATVVAAFFGAWYAFRKQNQREAMDQIRLDVEAANRAIFTIHTIWEIRKSYQSVCLRYSKYPADILWVLLEVTPITKFGRTSFDVERLDFLLSSKHVSVYRDLLQEERRFEIFTQLIERRNERVVNNLRPVIEGLGLTKLKPSDIPAIEHALGPDISSDLKSITGHIIVFNNEDIPSLEALYPRLSRAVTSMYRNQEFVTVSFDY